MNLQLRLIAVIPVLLGQWAPAIMERGDYPWGTKLRCFYDDELQQAIGPAWLLNLGPTGIRARIYPDKADQLAVKYVFQDAKSPAKGLVAIGDIIVGANGSKFKTSHRFGRNLPGGGGWDGPMLELAGHLEDSQGTDGVLKLIVWPQGDRQGEKEVPIQLEVVGRFAETFPYNCVRSEQMLEKLCEFMVMDYESGNWKKENAFYGGPHNEGHQMLALMAAGIPKYDRFVKDHISSYYGKRYDPAGGGFQTWKWGFEGIVMGEYYLLHQDRKLLPAIESLTAAMPLGSRHGNGIYTHRSELNLRLTGRKPYASIAAISGLQMVAMSLFDKAGIPYDEDLRQTIHQHYLNSATESSLNIAYAFGSADRFNDADITHRHAILKLADKSKGRSGKGPGFVVPTGMRDLGEYEIFWPTKADPRWKPTDWIAKEAGTNIVTELKDPGVVRVDRNHPDYRQAPEPTKPYKTTKSGGHLAPVGMGALAHLIGNRPGSWDYLGQHAANTCVVGPGNIFDGHASSNLSAFWAILGAAQSDRPEALRAYLDYMKTFLILSEAHNGGLIIQPWGRDRPGSNSDVSYGPRTLATATGAIVLALGKRRLQVTGANLGRTEEADSDSRLRSLARKARTLPGGHYELLSEGLLSTLIELSEAGSLEPLAMELSKARAKVWLAKVEDGGRLTFQALQSDRQAVFEYSELAAEDRTLLARLVARYRPEDVEAQATAGIFCEMIGDTKAADSYYEKAGTELKERLDRMFEQ
ncbi:DUF6288 domain-containing protein [Haloferula sp. A504]|uniref:DUF6288 domain-containing protein n=1 Tax=Haloferula sp. A504 TaxID=3373601 RepID=UPI0031CA821A|nr:DUF6288 domain-containing protein [Verrucomicrobiaceae bacterium E54]